jgi:hypothetical protein
VRYANRYLTTADVALSLQNLTNAAGINVIVSGDAMLELVIPTTPPDLHSVVESQRIAWFYCLFHVFSPLCWL